MIFECSLKLQTKSRQSDVLLLLLLLRLNHIPLAVM